METCFVVSPESERLLYGERKTAEYVVANPLNIEVELKSGEIHRPQEIRERITRCRNCVRAYQRSDAIYCSRSLRWGSNDRPAPLPVEPYGFCAWGEPREEDA